MLKEANLSLRDGISKMSKLGVEAAFLSPTPTGLEKSIMDATIPLQGLLKRSNIHNFEAQEQGQEHKVLLPVVLISGNKTVDTKISLYRPETKNGDPRFWIYNLGKHANARDLLAIVIKSNQIYCLNISNKITQKLIEDGDHHLTSLFQDDSKNDVLIELEEKLRSIASKGFIKTLRQGPTGVGMTLETLLGIEANSSKAPDYKGVEIKATRVGGKLTRITLFSQVPEWKRSPNNAMGLITKYGYRDKKDYLALRCSIASNSENTQGLFLELSKSEDDLNVMFKAQGTNNKKELATLWGMKLLRKRLTEKHHETIWVKAENQGKGEDESFHYTSYSYSSMPAIAHFDSLIESGSITVDFVMKKVTETRVRDHGFLFKIWHKDLPLLFTSYVENKPLL